MENCPVHLRDHNYWRRRISARRAEKPEASSTRPQPSAENLGQKRKRSSEPRPPAQPPVETDFLSRPLSATIPPADLPLASKFPRSLPASTEDQPSPPDTGPLTVHNRSVDEFQIIYHEVADDLLRYKSGRVRPYSLDLGRRLKQKLWESLDRPSFTESEDEDGQVSVDVSYGRGVYPPLFDIDTIGEPSPEHLPRKRAKKSN